MVDLRLSTMPAKLGEKIVLRILDAEANITDLKTLSVLREDLARCQQLNVAVQDLFRAWGRVSRRRNSPQMLDQASLPWFSALNAGLTDQLDEAAFRERLRTATRMLRELASEIAERAVSDHPHLDTQALQAAIGTEPLPPRAHDRLFAPQPD